MDLHNSEGGASPPPIHPSLPCTVSDINDVESFVNALKKLSTRIVGAVSEGKSVTAANKKLITAAAVEIIRVAEIGPKIIAAEHRPEPTLQLQQADLKSDIITAVRQELADFRKQTVAATTTNQQQQGPGTLSYAQAASTASKKQKSSPQTTPPVTRPALIITSKKEGSSSADTLSSWRASVSFKDTNFAPAGVHFVSNNKLRVEFDNETHLQTTLKKVGESNQYISAEVSRKLKPMFIVRGVNSDMSPEDLKLTIINQNDSIKNNIKDNCDLEFKFKRPNKNEKLYNAVFITAPYLCQTILKTERLNVDHQRLYIEEFTPLLQCFKCLRYGHTRKHCNNSDTHCSHCSESGHEYNDCPVKKDPSKVKCHNCKTFAEKSNGGSDKLDHSATSDSCPRKQSMIYRTRLRIDYGS